MTASAVAPKTRSHSFVRRALAVFMVMHGVAHFVGLQASLQAIDQHRGVDYAAGLWTITDPTTLRVFAVLWGLAGAAWFVIAPVVWLGNRHARAALIAVTVATLVLAVAALSASVIGVVIDIVILAVASFEPHWIGLGEPID